MNKLLKILKQILIVAVSLFILSLAVFVISRLAPGDPLISYYGDRTEKMSVEEREFAMEKLGLNDSIPVQYTRWLKLALTGDFGISYKYKQPVSDVIASRLQNTLTLGGIGFVILFALALLLGILCAWHEDKWLDKLICKVGTISSCIPEFWFSLLLILVFSVTLRWLPSSGAYDIGMEEDIGNRILHMILPLTVIVTGHLWYYAYMIRNLLLDEIRSDYVLLAKSKGLSKSEIIRKHCIRNILPAYFSIMAISVPHVMGGTYIVEAVFSYPGIGTLSYESARYHDYNLLMLICLISGAVVILCNMISQSVNESLDPRMKTEAITEDAEVIAL
ncbi:MAG: ABC transporter permease [Clostridia bacterium]|nr:ABC transporter permease [Clostridia bacterium]